MAPFFFLFVTLLVVNGCGRKTTTAEIPPTATPAPTNTPGGPTATPDPKINKKGPYDYDGSTALQQCIVQRTDACEQAKKNCDERQATDPPPTPPPQTCVEKRATCIAAITTEVWPKGCKAGTDDDPAGDPVPTPDPEAKTMTGTLTHCTNSEDMLVVNQGVMSFVTVKAGEGPISGGFAWQPWYWGRIWYGELHGVFFQTDKAIFATAGESWNASAELHKKAKIKLNGENIIWSYPGALGFTLANRIQKIDMTRAIRFVATDIRTGTDAEYKGAKYTHFENYWGPGVPQDVVRYGKHDYFEDYWCGFLNLFLCRRFKHTDCQFETDFELQYYERPTE
ncbi:MAG: hypothetical protein V1495_01580 [Pseudomonadota bacterium]